MPSLFNALSSSLPTAVGNTLGSIQQKISEVGREVANTFGGAGPLTRLQATGSTIQEAAAQVTTQAAQFSGAIPRQDAINAMSGLAASNPATFNATTMLEAARSAESDVQEVSAAQVEAAKQENNYDDSYKVRLVGIGKGDTEYELIFDVMPEVVEARNVSYEDVAPPQSIGAFQKFKGTDPVSWNINATLVCRNIEEAGKNLQHMNQLRAWTMPFFGENTRKTFSTRLGAPPPTLLFSGWKQKMVGPTRVVITSLNWTFPRDVDYIAAYTDDGQIVPFPTVMTIAITLKESFSTEEFNNFDLNAFAKGNIADAYGITSDGTEEASVVTSLTTEGSGASEADPSTEGDATASLPDSPSDSTTPSSNTGPTATTDPNGEQTTGQVKTAEQPKTQGTAPAVADQAGPVAAQRRQLGIQINEIESELESLQSLTSSYERRLADAQALPDSDPEKAKKVERAQQMVNSVTDRIFAATQRRDRLRSELAGLPNGI